MANHAARFSKIIFAECGLWVKYPMNQEPEWYGLVEKGKWFAGKARDGGADVVFFVPDGKWTTELKRRSFAKLLGTDEWLWWIYVCLKNGTAAEA